MQCALVLSKGERIHHPLNTEPHPSSTSYAFQNLDLFSSMKALKSQNILRLLTSFLEVISEWHKSAIFLIYICLHYFPEDAQMYKYFKGEDNSSLT